MKKKKKDIKGITFVLPTFLSMFFMCLLPVMYALIHSKKITYIFFEVLTLIFTLLFVIFLLFGFLQAVYCMLDAYKNKRVKKNIKLFWYIILFLLNIFIVPYYYYRFMKKDKKFKKKSMIYILILLLFSIISISTLNILVNSYETVKLEEKKKKEAKEKVRNIYSSNDGRISMTFKLGFKKLDVSEYDLYVRDSKRNLITGVFLYDITNFEEKTPEAVLNKQLEYLKSTRKDINIYKNQSINKIGNKNIYSISVEGKNEDSSDCIYKLSAISFDDNVNNIIYVLQVSINNDYKKYEKELDEIVNSIELR